MLVLGCDPSLTAYGWSIVDRSVLPPKVLATGCIQTKKDAKKSHMYAADQDAQRVVMLARGLEFAVSMLDRLASEQAPAGRMTMPVRVVCEAPAGSRHAVSAKALGQSLGVTLGVLVARGYGCRFVQAGEVKLRMASSMGASKGNVAEGVARLTGWYSAAKTKPEREAESDATAVALTLTLEELNS